MIRKVIHRDKNDMQHAHTHTHTHTHTHIRCAPQYPSTGRTNPKPGSWGQKTKHSRKRRTGKRKRADPFLSQGHFRFPWFLLLLRGVAMNSL
jgi:hypothetical protein